MSKTSIGSSSLREPPSTHENATVPIVPHRPAEIRRVLETLGIAPTKRLGQSFLIDPFVADAEAALVGGTGQLTVVEIGGGLGILTEALLRRGIRPLTVVERDHRLANFLRHTFGSRITVLEGDALVLPLPPMRCAVGNLPFSIATPVLLRFFRLPVPRVVALVQSEVADRLVASPGSRDYGRLSIFARLYGSVEGFARVPGTSFVPEPAVEGRIILFERRTGALPVRSVGVLEGVVRTLFSARRKQLGNLLPRLTSRPGEAEDLADSAGWPEDWKKRRPEDLPPEAYFRLADLLTDPAPA